MSTDSPPAKVSPKVSLREECAAAVAADGNDQDVTIVDAPGIPSSASVPLKQEKVVDVTTDPSFGMLQNGGGQVSLMCTFLSCLPCYLIQVQPRRRSGDGFQRPAVPPVRPRSTRKSAPVENSLVETPSKKSKPSSTPKTHPRRGSTWLQDLKNLQQHDGVGGATGDVSGEDSLSSSNTFNDALSNISAASDTTGNWPILCSNFTYVL